MTEAGWNRLRHAAFVLPVTALIFVTHHRWILTHFSSDGYLEDSGWFAYLFESADPLLQNPSAVNDLSYYAHHLSPHLFLFGAPLSAVFGLTGFEIFAHHQGLFSSLLFLAFYVIATRSTAGLHHRLAGIAAAVLFGGLANPLFQAAGYPHFEIATISLTILAMAAWLAQARLLFFACLVWLPLVREDGGFYGAVACVACLAVEQGRTLWFDTSARLLIYLAVASSAASACSFLIQAWFFPGFSAFADNFAGEAWNHVTMAFVLERVWSMLRNWNILPVLLGSAVLCVFDVRYLAGLVLLSPVYVLHLLAIRPEHGYFTLYFALPWIIPCAVWLALFVRRSNRSQAFLAEGAIIVAVALALAAPVQAAAGIRSEFWYVARWAFERPVVDIRAMREFVLWAQTTVPGQPDGSDQRAQCVSQGIAALVPDTIRPDDVLTPDADLRRCQLIFLMPGDMDYSHLATRAQQLGFTLVGRRLNAELWLNPR